MAYLMKFKKKVASIVGEETDKDGNRFFAANQTYAIQPNDAVHFNEAGLATFVRNPKKRD